MKKYATRFEKLFLQRMLNEGLTKLDDTSCELVTEDCIITMYFGMTYNQKSRDFNSTGLVNVGSLRVNELFKDYNGDGVFRLYSSDKKEVSLICAPMIWYLSFHYGKDKYKGNMYTVFDKSTIIENVEEAVEYYYRELYLNVFMDIKNKYGSIALMDENINGELLKLGIIKRANIIWADNYFHCLRCLIVAYLNKNPSLPSILEICDGEMSKIRIDEPDGPRIDIYNFIANKIKTSLLG